MKERIIDQPINPNQPIDQFVENFAQKLRECGNEECSNMFKAWMDKYPEANLEQILDLMSGGDMEKRRIYAQIASELEIQF